MSKSEEVINYDELMAFESKMKKEISSWRVQKKHSPAWQLANYLNKADRYDWRESEKRRAQLKKERGL